MPSYDYECAEGHIQTMFVPVSERDDPVACEGCCGEMERKSVYLLPAKFGRYGGTKAAEQGVYESGLARYSGDPDAVVTSKADRTRLVSKLQRQGYEVTDMAGRKGDGSGRKKRARTSAADLLRSAQTASPWEGLNGS